MAGSVGGAVAGCPGYAGYIPSCQQPATVTTSSMTQRTPLVARAQASQKIGLNGTVPATEEDLARDPSVVFAPKRSTDLTLYAMQSTARPDPGDWQHPRTKAALLSKSQQMQTREAAPFSAKSTYGSGFALEKNKDEAFFSRVQQIEHADAVAEPPQGRNTRSSAKQAVPTERRLAKRQTDEAMAQKQPEFEATSRRAPLRVDAPPGSEVVFRAAHASVTSALREYGVRGYNPTCSMPKRVEDMARMTTTGDLASGTAKSTLGLRIPGYLGHVPQGEESAAKLRRDRPDLLKLNAQNTRIICTNRKTLPGYSGYEPRSLVNDKGRPNAPEVTLTSSGAAAHATLTASDAEKAMNHTDFAKQGGIRKFFTQGDGQPDHSISEQYFVKYRPMEGSLKMGPAAERTIPRTK